MPQAVMIHLYHNVLKIFQLITPVNFLNSRRMDKTY